ncbi:RING finger protein 222 [Zootoca vivipara]|uniref:RING finger protein 222 n=1 Tax=Zootoca vivipara TaxID=8524 RepID=UPI00293BFCA8|nr:RING finger protein 222 [Zootoca vivipara]
MAVTKTSKKIPAAAPSTECPVCYEPFQSPKVSRRVLSCGHAFCHDCLVKCLLVSRDEGRLQNCLTCPICRFVTFLCRKRASLNPPPLELPLSPSLLSSGLANTLVVPGHFLMSLRGYDSHQNVCGCPSMNSMVDPGGLERQSHVFIITQCGMPLIEENIGVTAPNRDVEAAGSVASHRSLIMGCFQSPIVLAIILVSTVALSGAVLPWLLFLK